jgi:ferredoxin
MKHQVRIQNTGEQFRCDDRDNLLRGMEALGRKGIPVGCRNGGCGICKVHITSGAYESRVMSRAHVTQAEEAQGQVLACRVHPRGDIELSVVGLMKKNFSA